MGESRSTLNGGHGSIDLRPTAIQRDKGSCIEVHVILRTEHFPTKWIQENTTPWNASQVLVEDKITPFG